jgi:seryl-tRNA synthetase
MIDIALIREQPEVVRAAILKKHGKVELLDRIIEIDIKRRHARSETEGLQATLNTTSATIPTLQGEEKDVLQKELRELSNRIKTQREELQKLDVSYLEVMRQIPNIPAPEVPDGASDKENVVVKTIGAKPDFSFAPRSHEEICADLDLLDMERGAKVSGAKFYYLKNDLVILEQAVLRWALDRVRAKGFDLLTVPNMVRSEAMYGAGYFSSPEDAIDGDAYAIERDELFLIGTAEVGLVNYHASETLREADLPLRYAGISPCYRREAGTYGKETRGLYRVHQFNKVEMVCFVRPEDSEREHELLLAVAEELLQALGLHYQIVLNCGGDLGTPHYKKWDIETWMPGMQKYGETHSCSNITDYQARTLNMRFRRSTDEKEVQYLHTLNNTVLASPRILVAILENYQQEDGSVNIPEVLVPYTGFTHIKKS